MATAGRRLGGRAVDAVLAVLLVVIVFLVVNGDRLMGQLFLAVLAVGAYEAIFVTALGATPGKLIAGTRVVELGHEGVEPVTALKRGTLIALGTLVTLLVPVAVAAPFAGVEGLLLTIVVVPVAVGFWVSVFASPLRRGVPDRVAGTFVVDRDAPARITEADLAGYTEIHRPPAMTRWGPAATLDQRRRARAGRLDDAPVLVIALVAILVSLAVEGVPGWVYVVVGLGWLGAFVTDETWRIARRGATAGHRRHGLVVVDTETGEPPGAWRALLRAVLLALFLYLPPLTLVLAVWVRLSSTGRGPHDLAARTVVIAHPALRRTRAPVAA